MQCLEYKLIIYFLNCDVITQGRGTVHFLVTSQVLGGGLMHPKCPNIQQWQSWEGTRTSISLCPTAKTFPNSDTAFSDSSRNAL